MTGYREFEAVLVDGCRPGYVIDRPGILYRIHLVEEDDMALFHPSRIETAEVTRRAA